MLTRVTTGTLAGYLAVELDCTNLDASAVGSLVQLWRQSWCSGARIAMVVNGPWDHPDFQVRVLELLTEPDAEDHTLWVGRSAGDTAWAGGDIWWSLDATSLLGASKAETLARVQLMPATPELAEVVVRDPEQALLRSESLDEISTSTGAAQAWLYVRPGLLEVACRVVARCTSVWGVRLLKEGGHG